MKIPKIDWPRTIAGALAAVAAAILLSKLGAAGTLIGAAIGSLVISIGTNVGAHGIQSTTERMLEAQKEAARKVSEAQDEVRRARAQVADSTDEGKERLAAAEGALESAQSELAKDVPTTDIPVVKAPLLDESAEIATNAHDGETQILPVVPAEPAVSIQPKRAIRWRQATVFSVASFVIALVAITGFELIGGRPLSSYTGGGDHSSTTIGEIGSNSVPRPRKKPTPELSPSPSVTPSASATPTPSPTPSPTTSTSPTASGSPTDVTSPTPATGSPSPTDSGSPTGPPVAGTTP